MEIQKSTLIRIRLSKTEYMTYRFSIHESDIIMFHGDTYIVSKIDDNFETRLVIITLEPFTRASNFYLIEPDETKIIKVADYIENCRKKK